MLGQTQLHPSFPTDMLLLGFSLSLGLVLIEMTHFGSLKMIPSLKLSGNSVGRLFLWLHHPEADPDLQIGEGGGRGHSDPEIRGRGRS